MNAPTMNPHEERAKLVRLIYAETHMAGELVSKAWVRGCMELNDVYALKDMFQRATDTLVALEGLLIPSPVLAIPNPNHEYTRMNTKQKP